MLCLVALNGCGDEPSRPEANPVTESALSSETESDLQWTYELTDDPELWMVENREALLEPIEKIFSGEEAAAEEGLKQLIELDVRVYPALMAEISRFAEPELREAIEESIAEYWRQLDADGSADILRKGCSTVEIKGSVTTKGPSGFVACNLLPFFCTSGAVPPGTVIDVDTGEMPSCPCEGPVIEECVKVQGRVRSCGLVPVWPPLQWMYLCIDACVDLKITIRHYAC